MNPQSPETTINDEDALNLFEHGPLDFQQPLDSQMEDLILACKQAREKMKTATLAPGIGQKDSAYLLTAMTR